MIDGGYSMSAQKSTAAKEPLGYYWQYRLAKEEPSMVLDQTGVETEELLCPEHVADPTKCFKQNNSVYFSSPVQTIAIVFMSDHNSYNERHTTESTKRENTLFEQGHLTLEVLYINLLVLCFLLILRQLTCNLLVVG
jgi:hypothetical protein